MPNPLYKIPGYGGYAARRDQQAQEGMQELQKAGALLSIKNKIEEQRAAQAQQQMFQNAGGDMSKAMEAALRAGNIDAASKIARIIESQNIGKAPKGYGPGTQIIQDGKVVHEVPFAPRPEPQAPNEVRLVDFYNKLPDTDPRKPLIKQFIEAKTRPPQGATPPVLQTPEGVFERTPQGLRPLNDPRTNKPLTQKSTEDGLTPENAGKVAMAQQSVEAIKEFKDLVFKDGKMNMPMVIAVNTPYFAGMPGNSKARMARSKIRNAIEAKLRLETGAAATESEINRTMARFMPTPADTDESAVAKLDDLGNFFEKSLSLTKGIPKAPASGPSVDDLLKKYGGS